MSSMRCTTLALSAIALLAALSMACKNPAAASNDGRPNDDPNTNVDPSASSHVRFSLEDAAAAGIHPTHVVYMDALSKGQSLVKVPVTAGIQDIALPKGGYYVMGLVEEGSAARGSLDRGIGNSIKMLGSIKVLASGLDSLPLTDSAAATIDLGEIQPQASSGDLVSTIAPAEVPAATGNSASSLETVARYDDGLLKMLNPDIDGDGVYDSQEGLTWSFACRYKYSLRYVVRSGSVADSDVRLELTGVEVRINILDSSANPGDPTRELTLPPDFNYVDPYGLRVRKLIGVSAATQTGGDVGPATETVFADFPICSGDFAFAYGGKTYAIANANFFNAKADLEGWVFPVLNGSRDASGSFTSLKAEWKKIAAGAVVDAGPEDARMTTKSLTLIGGGRQYTLDEANGWSAGSLLSPAQASGLYLNATGLDGAIAHYYPSISFEGSAPRILAKAWEYRAPFGVGGSPFAVRSRGTLGAVLSSGRGGSIELVDLADLAAPKPLGTIAKTNPFADAVLLDGYLCAVDSQDFFVYDVRNPSSPELVTKITTSNMMAKNMAVDGNKVYVTGDFNNVYDLANPRAPRLLASTPSSFSHANSLTVKNGIALIGDAFYDLADPAAWAKKSTLTRPVTEYNYYHTAWEGSVAAFAFSSGGTASVLFYDVSDPANPIQVARDDFGGSIDTNDGNTLVASAGRFYVTWRTNPTHVVRSYSAASPTSPPSLLSLPGWYGQVGIEARADGKLLCACGGNSNSAGNSAAELLAYNPDGSGGYALASRSPFELQLGCALFEGGSAFAATGSLGIAEFEYDSSAMRLLGFAALDAGETARGLFKAGATYVAISDKAAYSFSLSGGRLSRRSRTEGIALSGKMDSALVDGGVAYLSGAYTSLLILDVSNPDAPIKLAAPYNDGRGLYKYANRLYMGNGSGGITILDVTNPANPIEKPPFTAIGSGGNYSMVNNADSLAGLDRYLYVANGDYEIVCFDLGPNPDQPTSLFHARGDGELALRVAGTRLYGISYAYGYLPKLNVLSLDDQAAPASIDQATVPEFEWKNIAVEGDSIFLSSEAGIVERYELR